MVIPYITTDVDLQRVAESHVQNNYQNFAVSTLPKALVLDKRSGRSNTTNYNLSALATSLTGALSDWAPGIDPPGPIQMDSTAVAATVRMRTTQSIVRSLRNGAAFEERIADLTNNIVPIQLSKCWQDLSIQISSAMTDTAKFQRFSFTGSTGEGLDQPSDYSNQNPINDIEKQLVLLRPYVNMGFELRAYLSGRTASVLAQHPSYTGTGGGVAAGLPMAQFKERFSAIHGCTTHIFSDLMNSADYGATATIVEALAQTDATTVCFFGLFDTRGGSVYDLRSSSSNDAPDGALFWACSQDPTVAHHLDSRRQTEEFWGRHGSGIISPRGAAAGPAADLGFFMRGETSGADLGIFK